MRRVQVSWHQAQWFAGSRLRGRQVCRAGCARVEAGVRRTPLSGISPCSRISWLVTRAAGWQPAVSNLHYWSSHSSLLPAFLPGWCCPGSDCTPPGGCSSRWVPWQTCAASAVVVQHCGGGFCTTFSPLRARGNIRKVRVSVSHRLGHSRSLPYKDVDDCSYLMPESVFMA